MRRLTRRVLNLARKIVAGYGSRLLLDAGASRVVGIDLDPRNVRYAARRYNNPELSLMIARWLEMLAERFGRVTPFRHDVRPGIHPDFGDPFPSRLSTADFVFEEIESSQLTAKPTITALFVAETKSE